MRKKFLILTIISACVWLGFGESGQASATSCNDLEVIFARGSGAPLNTSADYLDFKSRLESKLKLTNLKYNFTDLDYPAAAVPGDLGKLLGIYVNGGDAYEFGDSVREGEEKIKNLVNDTNCPNTKFVLAGYSQGAMTITKVLSELNSDQIIYVATFGDPKLYLPEGIGIMPPACQGKNLSSYRVYVPDCHTHDGLLGGINPYQPASFDGKLGTWCDKFDIFCSSYFSVNSHVSYVKDNLYEDASKLIFNKITEAFEIKNNYISAHDTAILIDSTGSMSRLSSQYKNEVLKLTKETLENNGRVALYDYRDISDKYAPRQHCVFETCTLEIVQKELDEMEFDDGGDVNESLLSASFNVMKELNWRLGATKSLVVLTDACYHEPDLDGVTMADVVQMSKTIDPVNFYIIVDDAKYLIDFYTPLAEATDGRVITNANDSGLLTDQIMERFDSLPRVEEAILGANTIFKPTLRDIKVRQVGDGLEVSFVSDGEIVLVALDDAIIGMTDKNKIIFNELRVGQPNALTLAPVKNSLRGNSLVIDLSQYINNDFDGTSTEIATPKTPRINNKMIVPKAPNTGRAI